MDPLRVELTIDQLQVHKVVGFELVRELGRPGRADVDVRMLDEVPPEALLGQSASLHFGYGAFEHVFTGVIDRAAAVATTEQGTEASWQLAIGMTSHLGVLEHSTTSRIFQDLSVPDIVSAVLEEHGLPANKQAWRLGGSYPKREYCVQYEESALGFCQRLLEKEGIFYSLRTSREGERVIFEDASAGCDPLPGGAEVAYVPASGQQHDEQVIHTIVDRHRVTCGAVTLRDYDFEKPDLDLTVDAKDGDEALAVYDFPGGFVDPGEGKRYAQVQLEAARAKQHRLEVVANCAAFMEGWQITLTDAGNRDGDYVIVAVAHRYAAVDGGEPSLRVEASLLPVAIPYRTPQETPKPVIDGPQTAMVVAPEGAPPESIHTDEWGRAKVKFHWDLDAPLDDRASCWIRTQQMQASGSMILPRVDWEVVVEFQHGDPDRPLITGRVYNGRYKPPYELPEGKTRSALGSATSPGGGGRNEIRFEDAAGKEEISLKAEKNLNLATGNNKTKTTGNDDSQSVAANRTLNVGANQTIRVTSGYQNSVTGTQTVSVGGNREATVDAVLGLSAPSFSCSVGGNQFEMDSNPLAGLIDLAADMAKDAAQDAAKDAMKALDEAVKGKIDAVMGPIEDLQGKLGTIQEGMEAAQNGDLSGMADAASKTAGLPTPEQFGEDLKGQALQGAKDAAGGMPGGGLSGASGVVDGFSSGESHGKSGGGDQGGGHGDGGGGGHDGTLSKKGGGGQLGTADDGGGHDGTLAKKGGGGQLGTAPEGGGGGGGHGDGGGHGGGGHDGTLAKSTSGQQTAKHAGGPEKSTMDQAKDLAGAAREGNLSAASGLDEMVTNGINDAVDGTAGAVKDALGMGQSGKNFPGPPGGVSGNAEADNKCGPGHSVHQVNGAYSETIGSLRATLAASTINTNIGATRTQTIGAARVEIVNGLRAEACADKSETTVGLIVIAGGDEGEAVGGTKTSNIGGALLAKVGSDCKVAAAGPAAFIGAVHKVDASGKITFNCGASSVVIDGGGITIASPMVTIAGATVTLTKTVDQGPGGGAGGGGGAGPGGATGGSGGDGGAAQGGEGGGGGGGATTGGSGQDKGEKDGGGKGADQSKDKWPPHGSTKGKPPPDEGTRKKAAEPNADPDDGKNADRENARKECLQHYMDNHHQEAKDHGHKVVVGPPSSSEAKSMKDDFDVKKPVDYRPDEGDGTMNTKGPAIGGSYKNKHGEDDIPDGHPYGLTPDKQEEWDK